MGAPYDQALLGLEPGDEAAVNDDRVGRTLHLSCNDTSQAFYAEEP